MAQLAERPRFNLLVAGSILIFCARVAQLVEHWSNKPTVAGSIPVVSIESNHTFCIHSREAITKRGCSSIGRV